MRVQTRVIYKFTALCVLQCTTLKWWRSLSNFLQCSCDVPMEPTDITTPDTFVYKVVLTGGIYVYLEPYLREM